MSKNISTFLCAFLFVSVSACGTSDLVRPERRSANTTSLALADLNALVPALGFSPGNPAQVEDRVGPTGVKVPGRCPPTQEAVNAQVALRNPQFPTGTDLESRIQRFEKTLSAIQDLKCPASSTTLLGRLNSLTALRGNPNANSILQGLALNETPADRGSAPATSSNNNGPAANQGSTALVPALGFSPGNPNQVEDRVGPTGVKVPGRCPPTQEAVNAQVALRNPQFPTGTDLESRIQRFERTLSAIQDLKCPAASTTLLVRLNSLTALRGNPNANSILQGLGFNETPADRGSAPVISGNNNGQTANQGSANQNSLVPALGFSPGNPNQVEDRVGPTGVRIPGRCPPTQEAVNAQVAAKNPQFPRGTDLETRIQRFEKTLSAIQDLKCPAGSTTLLVRLNSLTALRGNPNANSILQGLGFNQTPADR